MSRFSLFNFSDVCYSVAEAGRVTESKALEEEGAHARFRGCCVVKPPFRGALRATLEKTQPLLPVCDAFSQISPFVSLTCYSDHFTTFMSDSVFTSTHKASFTPSMLKRKKRDIYINDLKVIDICSLCLSRNSFFSNCCFFPRPSKVQAFHPATDLIVRHCFYLL